MKLYDTSLPENYSSGLYNEKCFDLGANNTHRIAYVLFTGTSAVLQNAKSKDHPVCFEYTNIDGSFIAAAIVRFFENEDPTKPGNWNLVWTFYETDIPAGCYKIDIKDPNTYSFFRSTAGEKYGIKFKDASCIVDCLTYLLLQIRKWLDENAKENEEVSVELDSVFQARVAVENGEKVFALEPAGEIKMLIKDDAAIEK